MLALLLPVLALATPAQQQLAGALADADSVDAVTADRAHHTVTFAIDRAGEAYEIVARIADDGDVEQVTVRDRGLGHPGLGPLSWLVDAMAESTAVVRLDVNAEGAVTLVTDAGEAYRARPGRGDGNDAVRARWEAMWDA